MHSEPTLLRRLTVVGGAILIAAGTTLFASAATPVPLEKLSAAQRLSGASDSTVVKAGSLTTTLGKLRTAHNSRESALKNATAAGSAAHAKLKTMPLKIIGIGNTKLHPTKTPFPLKYQPSHGYPIYLSNSVTEPASQYAKTPKDMKAFCAAAHASACAYLPPQQQVIARNGSIDNFDALITSSQCSGEGGVWNGGSGGVQSAAGCDFFYQMGVTVHFNPGSRQHLSQSAVCNSPWTYGVDVHGAVWISLASSTPQSQWWTTGSSATCIVNVTPGP